MSDKQDCYCIHCTIFRYQLTVNFVFSSNVYVYMYMDRFTQYIGNKWLLKYQILNEFQYFYYVCNEKVHRMLRVKIRLYNYLFPLWLCVAVFPCTQFFCALAMLRGNSDKRTVNLQ